MAWLFGPQNKEPVQLPGQLLGRHCIHVQWVTLPDPEGIVEAVQHRVNPAGTGNGAGTIAGKGNGRSMNGLSTGGRSRFNKPNALPAPLGMVGRGSPMGGVRERGRLLRGRLGGRLGVVLGSLEGFALGIRLRLPSFHHLGGGTLQQTY